MMMTTSVHPLLVIFATLAGAVAVLALRRREASRPLTIPRIVMPPLGMSTGFSMFLFAPTRVPPAWAALAVVLGAAVFAWPLVRTSKLAVVGGEIFVQRSKAFLWILLGLVAVRFALREWVEHYVGLFQTGSLLYLLAFGMVARWRVQMLFEYRALRDGMARAPAPSA